MSEEIPLFFNTPFDDNEVIDVDETFSEDITEEEEEGSESIDEGGETEPDIKDIQGEDELEPDPPPDDTPQDIDEVLEANEEITGNSSDAIKDLDEKTQENIFDDIITSTTEATDKWYDEAGNAYDKLSDVGVDEISKLTSVIEDTLGLVCNANITTPEFDIPVFDNIFKDLVFGGLDNLLDCLFKESLINISGRNMGNLLLDCVMIAVDRGSVKTALWIDDKLGSGIHDTFSGDIVPPVTQSMNLPLNHKLADNKNELDKMTRLFDKSDPHWYSFGITHRNGKEPRYRADPFVGLSDDSRTLFESDEEYRISVTIGEVAERHPSPTLADTYPLSHLTGCQPQCSLYV